MLKMIPIQGIIKHLWPHCMPGFKSLDSGNINLGCNKSQNSIIVAVIY